ncbi:PAS domain S-box protein [Methanosarcina sp. KYL-1]|uniref:PAS domain-containing protein n=1 Tax=Methanosarcina sp. KYL-1 TaxID=2602068 RepID=UPI002101BDE2|nr:PAS domain S-box protein [Methanosarcina sp. KYL-1]MCQ1535866.1 PAS domain S-box protein [Methanosarcina sp. KYL-1]
MKKKKLQFDQNEDRSSSFGDGGPLIDHSHNLEEIIKHSRTNKHSRTKDVFSANEDIYRSFFKENNAVLLLVNPENSDIVDANTAACKYYGWTLEEMTGKKMCHISALAAEETKAETLRAADEKRNFLFSRHRLANGEIRDVEVYGGPVVLNSQSLLYYRVHDITERKLAEDELQRKEMQLRTAQRVGRMGSWEIDFNSRKGDASEEARRIYGLEGEDLTIETIQKVPMPEYRPGLDRALSDLVERNLPYDVQFRILRQNDGRILHIHSVAEYDAERNVVIGTIQDITEQKQSEEALAKEALWRRILMEQSRDGIFVVDQNCKFFEANPRYAEMLGYSQEEMLTLHIWDCDIRYTREQLLEMLRIADSKGALIETRLRRKDGTFLDVEINANAAIFGERKLSFCVCRDITERKQAEEELLNAKLSAEAASKSKGEFLATVSHELRTPLNSIIGFSDVLLQGMFGSLNEKQTGYINHISKSGKHLLNLINDILDISKVEAGKTELACEQFNVYHAINEIKTIVSPLAIKKNICLDVKVDIEPQPGMIFADKTKFKQILYNLTSNAIKFTPEKGNVTIEARRSGNFVQVSVKDTGIGISKNDIDKLFQPFKQLNPYLTREYEGTGLGLALVKKFVEMHGGEIRVESKVGEGSIFTFLIPSDLKDQAQTRD